MKIKLLFLFLFALSITKLQALNYDMVVALDGSGDYTKIQDAIDAAPNSSSTRTVIYIKDGNYHTEKLMVPSSKKNISLIGESREGTIISYCIYDCDDGKCPTDSADLWSDDLLETSATLTIEGAGFIAKNLTIENTAGPVGQAQAITVTADKAVFINCNLTGYQDTIYFWSSAKRSYFQNCMILGRTDYIYGSGLAFFEDCEIQSYGGGYITAPSTSASEDYGFVFYECDLTYNDDSPRTGDDGSVIALGRPWHNYPKVSWLYCDMTDMIAPKGWTTSWHMDYASTSDSLELYEYCNTGSGADMSSRADWKGIRELTSDEAPLYERSVVLAGDDGWDPLEDDGVIVDAFDTIEAEDFDFQNEIVKYGEDSDIEYVGKIQDGDWIGFSNVNFGIGAVNFTANLAATGTATVTIMLDDSVSGTEIGTCTISSTGDYTTYGDFTCDVNSIAGVHHLFLLFEGENDSLLHLNSFNFTEAETSTEAATLTLQDDGTAEQTIEYGESIDDISYTWTNATSVTVDGMARGVTTTINSNDKTVTFSGVPSVGGTFNYTVSTVGSAENISMTGSITVTTIDTATLTKKGIGEANQTISLGFYLLSFYYSWTDATTVSVTDMPDGITTTIDTTEQEVSFTGAPTTAGVYNYTITTVGADVNVSVTGTITVTDGSSDDDDDDGETAISQNNEIVSEPKIYPNPLSGDELTIIFGTVEANTKVEMFNIIGTKVYSNDQITGSETTIKLDIPKGNYVIKISNGNKVFRKQLIVN